MYAAGGWARRRTRVRVAGAVWTTARTVVPTGLSGSRARTVPGRAGEEGVAGAEGAAGADGPLARRPGMGGSFSRRGPRPSLAIKAAFLTGSPKPRTPFPAPAPRGLPGLLIRHRTARCEPRRREGTRDPSIGRTGNPGRGFADEDPDMGTRAPRRGRRRYHPAEPGRHPPVSAHAPDVTRRAAAQAAQRHGRRSAAASSARRRASAPRLLPGRRRPVISVEGLHELLLRVVAERGLQHGSPVGLQRFEELVRGGLAEDDQQG